MFYDDIFLHTRVGLMVSFGPSNDFPDDADTAADDDSCLPLLLLRY